MGPACLMHRTSDAAAAPQMQHSVHGRDHQSTGRMASEHGAVLSLAGTMHERLPTPQARMAPVVLSCSVRLQARRRAARAARAARGRQPSRRPPGRACAPRAAAASWPATPRRAPRAGAAAEAAAAPGLLAGRLGLRGGARGVRALANDRRSLHARRRPEACLRQNPVRPRRARRGRRGKAARARALNGGCTVLCKVEEFAKLPCSPTLYRHGNSSQEAADAMCETKAHASPCSTPL
jgi:hypothetical protein